MEKKTKERKIRIIQIITQGDLGGAQSHVYSLIMQLKNEFDFHFIIGDPNQLGEKLTEQRIPVYPVPALIRSIDPLRDLQAVFSITKIIRDIKPDLVCTHSSKAGIIGRIAARLCGIPAIFTAHGWAFSEGVSPVKQCVYACIERSIAAISNKIICVSQYDYELARRSNVAEAIRMVFIHNGIEDLQVETPKFDTITFIMVARFAEPKDQQLVLQAISKIKTTIPFEMIFVGDGPTLPANQAKARSLDLTNVRFLGARTDIDQLLTGAHCFLLVSKSEGFPISILEAMRAGLPVIASDVGGVNEAVVHGTTGFLVPRSDVETLAACMTDMLENTAERLTLGNAGRDRFRQYFTVEHMADQTEKQYREILAKNSNKREM